MSEAQDSSVWWRINSRLEVESIPLFGFHFSPRMLMLTFLSLIVGFVVSAPIPVTTYRVAVLGIFTLAGFMVSSKRVKMTPLELIILYRFTRYKAGSKPAAAKLAEPEPQKDGQEDIDLLPIEDFTRPTPYSVRGRLRVAKSTKLSLFLDSRLLDEYTVTPTSSQYWFVYKPEAKDIGTHDLTVRAEGLPEPVFQRSVAVSPQGKEMLLEEVKK